MTLAMRREAVVYGSAVPRIGPPTPLRHDLAGYRETAATIGIEPMPWQDNAAMYATAVGPENRWLYREVAIIVGRQNGKTTLTKPIIIRRLLAGRKIMHIAQLRELPRTMFEAIADMIEETNPDLLPRRRGKVIWARRGAGSESIVLTNGGEYRIAAAISGGRGFSFDDLLIDELREMYTFDVVNAAKPAQKFSENPQTIYLSNMGDERAVILNSLTTRSGKDPSLAYLEWSADPEYDTGDMRGWVQSNPAIGHYSQVLRELEQDFRAATLSGNLAGFESEALCRKPRTLRERPVDMAAWARGEVELEPARRPCMGISYDPSGTRASAALAWQQTDGSIALRILKDVPGSPVNAARLGKDLLAIAKEHGARLIGFDPLTDAELAKHFRRTKPITGREFANASATFGAAVDGGRLKWDDCGPVSDDLLWAAKKEHDESGSFQVVRADDEHPITAVLAAIRAVWLASVPRPAPVPSRARSQAVGF